MIGLSHLTYFFLLLLRIRLLIIIVFEFRLQPDHFFLFFIVFADLNFSLVLILHSCLIFAILSLLRSLFLFKFFLLLATYSFDIFQYLRILFFFDILLRPHVFQNLFCILLGFFHFSLLLLHYLLSFTLIPPFYFWEYIKEQIAYIDCDNWQADHYKEPALSLS